MRMPSRRTILLASIPIAAGAWIAVASKIYCSGIGRPDLFAFPWDQWIQVLPYWRANWWVTLWVVVSAALPTLLFGSPIYLWLRRRITSQPIYGRTRWATKREMTDSKIVQRREVV